MEVIAIPQTPIRIMCKKFNALYYLNKELNSFLGQAGVEDEKIKVVQIFFDTEIPKDNKIQFLKLKNGILQIVAPFDWSSFSKLDTKNQQKEFIQQIRLYIDYVVEKYSLQKNKIDIAFEEFLNSME